MPIYDTYYELGSQEPRIFQTNPSAHCVNTRNKHIFTDQLPTFHAFIKVHSCVKTLNNLRIKSQKS